MSLFPKWFKRKRKNVAQSGADNEQSGSQQPPLVISDSELAVLKGYADRVAQIKTDIEDLRQDMCDSKTITATADWAYLVNFYGPVTIKHQDQVIFTVSKAHIERTF